MKVDVIVTSAADDTKFKSRQTDELKTRLVRSRLAEQIEAEEVLLSNDIESRLQDHGPWYRRKPGDAPAAARRSHRGESSEDAFDWTSSNSDEDASRVAVDVKTSAPDFFGRAKRGASTPSSPPADDPEKNLDGTAMEADISSFFPAAKGAARKEGLSPRQRLLYRYQMEEMMMNNVEEEDRDEMMQDGSASSGFRDAESDFVDRSDSPCCSSIGATDAVDGNPGQDHPTDGPIRDCHICGYPPCSREDYDLHMKKIHFTHKCHLCIYWSRSPGRLNRHLKDFHGEPTDTTANKKPKNPRKYTCKHCDFYTYVQEEIWKHTRAHVPAAKLLSCPHCPFVCAFKHHMQYHMNNHLGHKPFKCSECNYRCNNKSMLNSHKKSHSNDYPYRCGVCNYAAKYRHALNIHLRKKKHLADGEVVLEEGHHHRGGRSRSRSRHRGGGGVDAVAQNPVSVGRVPPAFLPEQMWRQGSQIGKMMDYCRIKQEPDSGSGPVGAAVYPHAGFPGSSPHPPLISISDLSNVQELPRYSAVEMPARTTMVVQNCLATPMSGRGVPPQGTSIPPVKPASTTSSLAATQRHHHNHHHSSIYDINNQRHYHLPPVRPIPPSGTCYRIPAHVSIQEPGYSRSSVEEWPLDLTAKPPNPGKTENHQRTENHHHKQHQQHHRTSSLDSRAESPQLDWYECQHCGIIFPDSVLYKMHMEYHSPSDPFQCGLCGQRTKDRREFFNHISQVAHN